VDNNYLLTFAERYLAAVAAGSLIVLILAVLLGKRSAYGALALGFVLLLAFFVFDAVSVDSQSLRDVVVPAMINTLMFGAGWLIAAFGALQLGSWIRRKRH
jgi:hypothetical protein